MTSYSKGLNKHISHALALIEVVKKNNRSKSTIRKLSARSDYYNARVELDSGIIRVILRDKWYILKIPVEA